MSKRNSSKRVMSSLPTEPQMDAKYVVAEAGDFVP